MNNEQVNPFYNEPQVLHAYKLDANIGQPIDDTLRVVFNGDLRVGQEFFWKNIAVDNKSVSVYATVVSIVESHESKGNFEIYQKRPKSYKITYTQRS